MKSLFILTTIFSLLIAAGCSTCPDQKLNWDINDYLIYADSGDSEAAFDLAESLRKGCWGVEPDKKLAIKYYRIAAEGGNTTAGNRLFKLYREFARKGESEFQIGLAECYVYGWGVSPDYEKVENWLWEAIESGNTRAAIMLAELFTKKAKEGDSVYQYKLGNCFRDGIGVDRDEPMARKWYLDASDQDYEPAQIALAQLYLASAERGVESDQYLIGNCYLDGRGVKRDINQGVYWLEKAALQKHELSRSNLEDLADKRNKNAEEALFRIDRYFAEKGESEAQYNLGLYYYSGQGTKRDYNDASNWFLAAALQGNQDALDKLRMMVERNIHIALQDYYKYNLAMAEKGDTDSQYKLAMSYLEGSGVKPNPEQAFEWFRESAEGHNIEAIFQLGMCYEGGIGTDRNFNMALYQFHIASEGRHIGAREKIKEYRENRGLLIVHDTSEESAGIRMFLERPVFYPDEGVWKLERTEQTIGEVGSQDGHLRKIYSPTDRSWKLSE